MNILWLHIFLVFAYALTFFYYLQPTCRGSKNKEVSNNAAPLCKKEMLSSNQSRIILKPIVLYNLYSTIRGTITDEKTKTDNDRISQRLLYWMELNHMHLSSGDCTKRLLNWQILMLALLAFWRMTKTMTSGNSFSNLDVISLHI